VELAPAGIGRAVQVTLAGTPTREKLSVNRIAFTPYKIISIEISRDKTAAP